MKYLSEHTYYNPDDFKNLVHIIQGDCSGVAITTRGEDDPHLMFTILMEDDGYYFPAHMGGRWSSYWIDDVQRSLRLAREWMEENGFSDTENGEFPKGLGWALKS